MFLVNSNGCAEPRKDKKHPQSIAKIRHFKYKYKWKKFSTGSEDWKKSEIKNNTISLKLLLLPSNSDGLEKNWTNLHFKTQLKAWKSSKGIIFLWKVYLDYYMGLRQSIMMIIVVCIVSIHSEQKNKLKSHENVCKYDN